MTTEESLSMIRNDPHSTRNEQDAASELITAIRCGLKPPRDCISVVLSYIRKQQRQDRYGK